MKASKNNSRFVTAALGIAAPLWILSGVVHADTTIFDNIPAPLAPIIPAWDMRRLPPANSAPRSIPPSATTNPSPARSVVLSNWAGENDSAFGGPNWTSFDDGEGGFEQGLTLNFYNVNATDPTLPGTKIGSVTQTFNVLWRPPGTGTGASGVYYTASDNNNYYGLAQTVTFDLSSAGITVPGQFIYTLAFNTSDYGADPTETPGPYDSLNVALVSGDPSNPGSPSVGSYANPDDVFWDTSNAGFYTDPTLHGPNVLQEDSVWTGYQPAASFDAVPEPTSFSLLGIGALAMLRRRRLTPQ